MRSTSLVSLIGVLLGVSWGLAACHGDDDEAAQPRLGDLGQSCTRTADCGSALVCVEQVCQKKPGTPSGNAGATGAGGSGATGGTGAKGGTGGTAPVLGGEGESCTRRADCMADLHCFNQRCTADGAMTGSAGEGGMGAMPPPPASVLGRIGETCVLPSDCAAGLTCMPAGTSGGIGVCGVADTGITPTHMSCSAECKTAADCCELPYGIITDVSNPTPFKSCADLAEILQDTDCSDPGTFARECFIQATYCECGKSTWKCTSAGQCQYNVDCQASGLTTDGCPTLSRSGVPLVATCNGDNRCASVPPDPECTSDGDCDTKAVADDPTDTCSPDECVCHEPTGLCYRRCDKDLDCSGDQRCDAKLHVCIDGPECTTDLNCQKKLGDVGAICGKDGQCHIGCNSDLDCNPSLFGMGLANVCTAEHVCESIGCTQDADCVGTSGVRLFCVADPAASTAAGVHSAITDGL